MSTFKKMKNLIIIWVVLILVCFNCNQSIEREIRSSIFQTVGDSPQIVGTDKLRLFDDKFEFKYEKRARDGNTEPNIKGYSGKFRIEKENLILEIEQVLCCTKAIEACKEKIKNKDKDRIYGSRYVNCEYRNYTPNYLESIKFNYKSFCERSFKIKQSSNGIQMIGNKSIYEKIGIDNLVNESDEVPLFLEISKTKLKDSIKVKFHFKNKSTDVIFLSNDYSYGGYSKEDSIMILDSEYFNNPRDWLIMPDWELSYCKLEPGESWIYEQTKKSNSIKVIYSDFNFIRRNRIKDDQIRRNLEKGFMTTEQLYSEDLSNVLEYGNIKIN